MRPLLLALPLLASAFGCAPATAPQTQFRVAPPVAGAPLRFESNAGHLDPAVRFVARGRGYALFLTADAAVFALPTAAVRMRFGAVAAPVGEDPLAGVSHHLVGDASQWRTGVPSFGRVAYRDVRPGVDLVFHSDAGRLEYDFVVAPGAEIGDLRLTFEGADALSSDASGDLAIRSGAETWVHRAPRAFEVRDGARREVASRLTLAGADAVRVEVAARDRTAALVIDPIVELASYLGAPAEDQAYGAGVDAAGNFYVAGITNSPTFPTTAGALAPTLRGGIDTFVTKFDATGALVWSTFLGGLSKDAVTDMAVDDAGAVYLSGSTASPNFPTVNAAQPAPAAVPEAFAAKLAPSGASLEWSTYLGGAGADASWGIAHDASGGACIAGETTSSNFPVATPAQPALAGITDAFVARVDASGALLWATYLGGAKEDIARDVAAESGGGCVAAGQTISPDFPVVAALQPALAGTIDSFVAKYDAAGARIYATYLGGTQSETARAVAVDASGAAYVTGGTFSPDFPTRNPAQPINRGHRDAFVTKLAPDGASLVYSTFLGGSGAENLVEFGVPVGGTLALDATGAAYLTGSTTSTNFPSVDPFQATPGGDADAFVAKLTPDGSRIAYASYLGGSGYDDARGIAVDGAGRAYVAGETFSLDFPTTAPLQPAHGGGLTDAFFAKIVPPAGVLSCEVEMSQASYRTGEVVTATVLHFANASAGPQPARLRLLATAPGWHPVPVVEIGANGWVYLPARLDAELAPTTLIPVTPELPRGAWSFGCELADPLTGAVLAADAAPFVLE